MRILLYTQSQPGLNSRQSLSRAAYLEWSAAAAKAEPARMALLGLDAQAGPGATVLCAPQPTAVATAQRVFPDRRIEVKTLYREPGMAVPGLPGRWKPRTWARLSLWRWMLSPSGGEDPQEAKRRVIDTVGRLIGLAKEHDEAVLMAGPVLVQLVALKLNALGFRGPLYTGPRGGVERAYLSELPSKKDARAVIPPHSA
jgi:hypothetical protein